MSAAWDTFSERVDDLGWTDTTDPGMFNYAVHHTMQALRDFLRESPAAGVKGVPDGWFVVNPRRMAELGGAEQAVARARSLAAEWASEPYAEEFTSMLAGVLLVTLDGNHD